MKEFIDPSKINSLQDLLDLVQFLITNTALGVEKDKVADYEKIERLLRKANNGTGN